MILLTLCMALVCSLTACYDSSESDEDTLPQETEEDTSPVSFDGQPYRFSFTSNGDGTCYISFLECNPDYPEHVTLHFPDRSPSGETVTAIRYKTYYSSGVPVVIAAEDFEAHILKPLAQTFPDGENSFGYMKFCAFFSLKNPSAEIGDSAAELLQKYPITAVTPVYMLDLSCSVEEEAYLTGVLQGIGYDTRACRADYRHLAELVKASNAENKNEILQSFPENPVYYTPNIVSMEFPEGLTEIDASVFANCRGLTSIALPPCATEICDSSFLWCSDLSAVTVPDGVRRIGEYAFSYCSSLAEVTIPDSVTSIGAYAFSSCMRLNNVTIGTGMTVIGNDAFSWCESLTSITIPDSVTSIGAYAFSGCSSLKNATIGKGVTSIADGVFSLCSNLTGFTIPDQIISIGESAFRSCSKFTTIKIPDGVTFIGAYAFSECDHLTDFTVPDSVTSIGEKAFSDCRSLNNVTIGSGVTSIGMTAFSGCQSLTGVTFKNTDGWYVFEHDDSASSRTDVAVTDAASAAEYLTGTYCEFFWKRRK